MSDFDILQIQKDRIKIQKRAKVISELLLRFKNFEMKDGTKNIIAAVIIALGLIISSLIYAKTTRYVVVTDSYALIVDKETQTAKLVHP